MILYVKNKFLSLGEGSFVVNEENEKVFNVKGKLFSPTRKKFVQDLEGNTLFIVRNKYWHLFMKKVLIYDGKTKEKILKASEKMFSNKLKITQCDDEIIMESNGLFKGVSVIKNGKKIGSWFFSNQNLGDIFRDSFKLEVYDESEAAFLVALVIAVDNIWDSRFKDND